jgi:hypothetical protein
MVFHILWKTSRIAFSRNTAKPCVFRRAALLDCSVVFPNRYAAGGSPVMAVSGLHPMPLTRRSSVFSVFVT